jgi:hypothetical protein
MGGSVVILSSNWNSFVAGLILGLCALVVSVNYASITVLVPDGVLGALELAGSLLDLSSFSNVLNS